MRVLVPSTAVLTAFAASVASATPTYFTVTPGAHPHDVAATREAGGPVYYTAQMTALQKKFPKAIRSEHDIKLRLSKQDRERIEQANAYLVKFKEVSLEQFRRE